jgi:hypothetical protein
MNLEKINTDGNEIDSVNNKSLSSRSSRLTCLITLASALFVIGGCKPNLPTRSTLQPEKRDFPALKKKTDAKENTTILPENNEKEVDVLVNITLQVKKMHAKYKMINLMLPYYFDRQKYEPENSEWPIRIADSKRALLKIIRNIDLIICKNPELKEHLSLLRNKVSVLLKKYFNLTEL